MGLLLRLGQFIASSPTVFPAEYVKEFQACPGPKKVRRKLMACGGGISWLFVPLGFIDQLLVMSPAFVCKWNKYMTCGSVHFSHDFSDAEVPKLPMVSFKFVASCLGHSSEGRE